LLTSIFSVINMCWDVLPLNVCTRFICCQWTYFVFIGSNSDSCTCPRSVVNLLGHHLYIKKLKLNCTYPCLRLNKQTKLDWVTKLTFRIVLKYRRRVKHGKHKLTTKWQAYATTLW